MVHVRQPSLRHTQNFLKSRRLVERLIARSGIGPTDLVLDLGAGRGIISDALVHHAASVVAVELDPRLAAALRRRFAGRHSVTVLEADMRRVALPAAPYKVFSNLPFDGTGGAVTRLLSAPLPPDDAYLVMQREAAARFTGCPRGTLWAATIFPEFEASIGHRFRPADFDPSPRVEVVMLRLRKRGPPLLDATDRRSYRDFVAACFASWQPSVAAGIAALVGRTRAAQIVARVGVDPASPPSAVQGSQWLALHVAFRTLGGAGAQRATHCVGTRGGRERRDGSRAQ